MVGMEQRREPRIPVEVQVSIAGTDARGDLFTQPATARSLSRSGALLTGIGRELRCGDILLVRTAGHQGKFKIVWVRDSQAAVHRLNGEPCPWKEMLEAVGAPP